MTERKNNPRNNVKNVIIRYNPVINELFKTNVINAKLNPQFCA